MAADALLILFIIRVMCAGRFAPALSGMANGFMGLDDTVTVEVGA